MWFLITLLGESITMEYRDQFALRQQNILHSSFHMVWVVGGFMFVLMIIGTAFLCGINTIYVPYVTQPYLGRFNETFRFLFWTMFGVANQNYMDMPEILYGIFTLVIVIVLHNMLIAMTSNSFQKIESSLGDIIGWDLIYLSPLRMLLTLSGNLPNLSSLSYFREGFTMPVPFNIPSPKAFFYLIRMQTNEIVSVPFVVVQWEGDGGGSGENQIPYRQQVIQALVQRYIDSAHCEFEETKININLSKVVNWITAKQGGGQAAHCDEDHHAGSGQAAEYNPNTDGSSILGKYIMGAKNNFRGFNNKLDHKHTPLLKVEIGKEGGIVVKQEVEVGPDGAEGTKQVGDMDVVKMEGRADGGKGDGRVEEMVKESEQKTERRGDSEGKGEIWIKKVSTNEMVEKKVEGEGNPVEAEARMEEGKDKGKR
ncbi:unnamed protein product [Coregonus sp. 'balchen']|nr:unnamed protein product [Coregonus sp. 'balchen']